MKKFFQIFFFLFSAIIIAQDEHEEYSAFDFKKNSNQKILIDKTKLRISPELNANILDSLQINQDVKILSRTNKLTKIGERNAPWFKISYNKNGSNNEGYIWGGNIALGYRKYKNIQFLFGIASTQKVKNVENNYFHNEMIARLVAIKDSKVISEKSFEMGNSENLEAYGFEIINNKNLKNVEIILKTMVSGAACGVPTYEQYLFWTNNSFYKLPRTMSVGDADVYSYSEEFQFFKNGRIVMQIEQYEKDENEKVKTSKNSKTYFWDGKNLK